MLPHCRQRPPHHHPQPKPKPSLQGRRRRRKQMRAAQLKGRARWRLCAGLCVRRWSGEIRWVLS
jgi:hypothetical protein